MKKILFTWEENTMHKLYYQPEGYWFGDCMPFSKDGVFYVLPPKRH